MTRNLFRSKKAGEKYLSLWWVLCLFIILVGITSGVVLFSVSKVNLNEMELNILNKKIISCFSDNNFEENSYATLNIENILEKCGISSKIINENYYLKIEIFKSSSCEIGGSYVCNNPVYFKETGISGIETQCRIKYAIIKAEKYPDCSESYFKFKTFLNNEYVIHVFSGRKNE